MLEFGYYNMDCIEAMKQFPDKFFDLAIVDPPYYTFEKLRYGAVSTTRVKRPKYPESTAWQVPTQEYYDELCRVSRQQIIWGINYFEFTGVSHGRIIWDKLKAEGVDYSDAEIASCSLISTVKTFRFQWCGFKQGDMKNKEKRIHTTQKPVALYQWLLTKFAKPGDKILDTHVGSASSLIACHRLGFDYVGFELDPHYYKISKARLEAEKRQITIPELMNQTPDNSNKRSKYD